MTTKRLLCPERLRRVPHRFSWIDQRLLRDGHGARCGPHALALYLLLATAADAQGLSYYSERTTASLLAMNRDDLREARKRLLEAGLIAYEPPLYQVLSLPQSGLGEGSPAAPRPACGQQRSGSGEPLAISAVLRQMFEAGNGGQRP
ncbi:MAG: hypothetical protein WB507_08250 [Solirubrobacterales bacterium]